MDILDCELGGDDDTFDYWPSAMRLTTELCNDIDALNNLPDDAELLTALQQVWDRVAERQINQAGSFCTTLTAFSEEVSPRPTKEG
jgi:hypothetical protein